MTDISARLECCGPVTGSPTVPPASLHPLAILLTLPRVLSTQQRARASRPAQLRAPARPLLLRFHRSMIPGESDLCIVVSLGLRGNHFCTLSVKGKMCIVVGRGFCSQMHAVIFSVINNLPPFFFFRVRLMWGSLYVSLSRHGMSTWKLTSTLRIRITGMTYLSVVPYYNTF